MDHAGIGTCGRRAGRGRPSTYVLDVRPAGVQTLRQEHPMKRHALAVLGYLVATFATQALSHFLIFASHYAQVGYMKEPIFPLGLSSMLVQGTILSFVYTQSRFIDQGIKAAVQCAWLFGAFLVSYIALAE